METLKSKGNVFTTTTTSNRCNVYKCIKLNPIPSSTSKYITLPAADTQPVLKKRTRSSTIAFQMKLENNIDNLKEESPKSEATLKHEPTQSKKMKNKKGQFMTSFELENAEGMSEQIETSITRPAVAVGESCTKQKRFECTSCFRVFDKRSQFNSHRLTHQTERPFQCIICEKTFKLLTNLKIHSRIHTGEKTHACDLCNYATCNKTVLEYHKNRRHNRVYDFVCEFCGKKLPTAGDLKKHVLTHGERKFKCKDCDKSYYIKSNLTAHLQSHNPNRYKFQCEMCGANYAHATSLKTHQLTHLGITRFKCEFCGKKLTTSSSLSDHRRMHTGEKPFSCEYCGKAFNSNKYLFIHRRIHTGEKPFKCQDCGKAFTQRGTLTIHMRSHTGIKPYQCQICPKAFFVTKTLLAAHEKSH